MSNSTVVRTELIPATGRLNNLGVGNFFMLLSSGGPVDVTFIRRGSHFGGEQVEGGYVKGLVEPWERVAIAGTPGASVRFIIGTEEGITEDYTDYRRTVGEFEETAPETVADDVDVDVGGSPVAVEVVPANAARASVTITNLDTSVANVRVGTTTVDTNRGQRLRPGQSVTLRARGAVYAIRESAAAASVSILEENF